MIIKELLQLPCPCFAGARPHPTDSIIAINNSYIIFLYFPGFYSAAVIIEKLLRSTNVQRIFLLIRSKKEKDINKRLNDLVDDPVSVFCFSFLLMEQ